jgi:uncharacterized protein YlaN (UPF0358 family)
MQTISIGHRGGSLDGTTLDYDEIDEVIKVQVAEETWHDCQAVYGIMHFERKRQIKHTAASRRSNCEGHFPVVVAFA